MSDILWKLLFALFVLQIHALALAQQAPATAATLAELALLDGSGRMRRLVEGARKEGELTVYITLGTDDFALIADAFTKKYGSSRRSGARVPRMPWGAS